jgi:aerobic-type carbon monoxide dehydrogenase small subunit (CoxS/CutS family)
MMVRALLDENPDPSDEDIGHYLSGNLCRCATYPEIIKAVQRAASVRRVPS